MQEIKVSRQFILQHLVCICLVFASMYAYTQQILIPYKKGKLFGISDEKANVVVQPKYNDISYLKDYYFQYTNTFTATDTFKKLNGELFVKSVEKINTGVFFKQKLIISNQPFKHFLVYKNCIVGSQNPYHPEKCALFNLNGQQLISEPIKGMGVGGANYFGAFAAENKKYKCCN